MKKSRLVPFKMLPAAWGLSGKPYREAEANYYYDGEDLERQLAMIQFADDAKEQAVRLLHLDLKYNRISQYEFDKKHLDILGVTDPAAIAAIEIKHGKMTQYDYDLAVAIGSLSEDSLEYERAVVEVKFRHAKIDKNGYDKIVATLEEKPWIGIVDQGFEPEKGVNGVFFEFDWNSYWIDYLRLNGYAGHIEEEIVEQWFQDVCRATTTANLTNDDVEALPLAGRRDMRKMTSSVRRDDGGTLYS
jgi:hypothetical protein